MTNKSRQRGLASDVRVWLSIGMQEGDEAIADTRRLRDVIVAMLRRLRNHAVIVPSPLMIAALVRSRYATTNKPVRGEYISLYLTGLGVVNPPVADGALGPASPLSQATAFVNKSLVVYFNDYTSKVYYSKGTVSFAGLAPGLAGLYQLNVQIPANVGPGNVYIELTTDNADVNQVFVPVGN